MIFFALLPTLAFADEPPAWVVSEAQYAITVSGSEATVDAQVELRPMAPGWFDGVLVGRELIIQSVSGPVVPTLDGLALTLPPGEDPVTVRFRGMLPLSSQGELNLPILPAAVARLDVHAPGFDVRSNAVDAYLHAADHLQISLVPHRDSAPSASASLVTAEVGTAFWEDEGSLAVRAEVHLRARRGSVQSTLISVAGLDEVDLSGNNIARWTREGDMLRVLARAPVKGSWVLAISGRARLGGPVPSPQPLGMQRTEAWWVLGRSSETELIPVSAPEGVPARAAPVWVRGLAETAPLAFFHGPTPPELRADRFEPLMGPETVIEQADFRVGLNEDGRVLLRATYLVRNERKQYLHFSPPVGFSPVAARVGSRPIAVLSDGAGGIYVSLERSLETVQGLVSFPLELTWLGEGEAWEDDTRRGEFPLVLPSVDAPIQHAEWTVHLPRGYRSLLASPPVAAAAAPSTKREAVQSTLDEAVQAYRKNDFETAQIWLDHARTIDADDSNVSRVQSNLDVLAGKAKDKDDDGVMSRRVKDLANAKSDETRNRQSSSYNEAKKAIASGDVEAAKEKLAEVLSSSSRLAAFEQNESMEQEDLRQQAEEMLANLPVIRGSVRDEIVGGVVGGELYGASVATAEEDVLEEPAPEMPVQTDPVTGTYSLDGQPSTPIVLEARSYDMPMDAVVDDEASTETAAETVVVESKRPLFKMGKSEKPAPAPKPTASPPPAQAAPPQRIVVTGNKIEIRDDRGPAHGRPAAAPSRAPLSVHPTVLTLAMPEGGAVFTRSEALLDPGEQPALTLRYRSGDPR